MINATPAAPAMNAVVDAVRDYHFALDMRENANIAAHRALDTIMKALDMPWVQAAEMERRQKRVPPVNPLPKEAKS